LIEANEAAIKLARKARPGGEVVVLNEAFHGRTYGALSATPQESKQAPFAPLVPGFRAVAAEPEALRAAVNERTAAVMLEPIQGESGVNVISTELLEAARSACDEHGAALIFDEIQTGMGRTGTFFAFEQLGVRPQLVTLAKSLANGLPIGALLVADDAAGAFVPGDHGSTFGGNPVACAAAIAVCDTIDDALLANVRANGKRLLAGLAELPGVVDARGAGHLVAAEFAEPVQPLVDAALDAGLVCLTSGPNVLRLAPALVAEPVEIDRGLEILEEAAKR
jgi:acetylornithine aminotransferase/acetylornithine/N-succinyldiaminopimelate aminotransferase